MPVLLSIRPSIHSTELQHWRTNHGCNQTAELVRQQAAVEEEVVQMLVDVDWSVEQMEQNLVE